MSRYDVAIIGAGMAGASLAAELAPHCKVLLLEAESRPGYHATGRSAAFWHETYGGPHVHPLSRASLGWLLSPPPETGAASFLSPRGAITMGRDADTAALDAFSAPFDGSGIAFTRIGRAGLLAHCPGLRAEWTQGVLETACADIDVAGAHQAYLKLGARAGTILVCNAEATALHRDVRWQIETRAGGFEADTLVDAAGAWADPVARLAGARPLGISPYRRTMVQLRFDREIPHNLPLMFDVSGQFYFKSDGAGGVWLSPHDEVPSAPCDAAPEELDVAIAIDRLEHAVEWQVRHVTHKWAGLRSFAPDRLPVYGFDRQVPGFFWFAGQGGFGIQTAPAAAKIGASMILGRTPDPQVAGIDVERYAPGRFAGGESVAR